MKIKYEKYEEGQASSSTNYTERDVLKFVDELKDKYGKIYAYQIDEEVFFYKPLTRGEFNKLCETELSELEKEDAVCQCCVVYPENYDFEDCEAALPSKLCNVILKASYLDSVETRTNILNYFRQEMFDPQNQITCLIHEAFPHYTLEEIEDWDMEKTAKYYSRAEWKLVNFRGVNILPPEQITGNQQQSAEPTTEEIGNEKPKQKDDSKTLTGAKKEKLTPEKLRELQQKFPDIHWEEDVVLNTGDIKESEAVDTTPAALRPGF